MSNTEKSSGLWTRSHKITKLNVAGDQNEAGDASNSAQSLLGQVVYIRYMETIAGMCMVELTFVDTNGFLDSLPIRSGMRLELEINHASREEDPFSFLGTKNNDLIVVNISDVKRESKREIFTLTCVTRTTLSNHTTRVFQRYDGNITDSVEKILTETLEIDSSRYKLDKTSNAYSFTGNYLRPINCISRLAAKSVSSYDKMSKEEGLAGFVFFESELTGYNFRSVDEMLKIEPKFQKYKQTGFKDAMDTDPFVISSQPVFVESHDLIKKLRMGQYKSNNVVYNIMSRNVDFYEYQSKVNDDKDVPSDVDELTSRRLLTVLDLGLTTKEGDELKEDAEAISWRHAHVAARYQSLFSQKLKVSIPMNLNLEVGQTLEFDFPDINTGDKPRGQTPSSGKYLIAKLVHGFGDPRGDFTGLSLVRDSFTPSAE